MTRRYTTSTGKEGFTSRMAARTTDTRSIDRSLPNYTVLTISLYADSEDVLPRFTRLASPLHFRVYWDPEIPAPFRPDCPNMCRFVWLWSKERMRRR